MKNINCDRVVVVQTRKSLLYARNKQESIDYRLQTTCRADEDELMMMLFSLIIVSLIMFGPISRLS